jgi:hypothetical protein
MSRYALPLRGYEDFSVWGFDELDATYYAQLWRNESDPDDDPDVRLNWLTGRQPIGSGPRLAVMIAARTGVQLPRVLRAMGSAKSAPEADSLTGLADLVAADATKNLAPRTSKP